MKLQGVSFPEAVRCLAERAGVVTASASSWPTPAAAKPGKAAVSPPETPSGLALTDALKLTDDAAVRIWIPEGAEALAYLRERGLDDQTIRAARVGWVASASIPIDGGVRYWRVGGVVIPWRDG